MPKLPRVNATETIRALEKLGFYKVSQKGSHVKMKKTLDDSTNLTCVVPLHRKTLAVGTLKSILNQAGVSTEQFIEKL